MANITNNSLFTVSALVFVVGLLFVAYPYLTLAAIILCAIVYVSYYHGPTLHRYYAYLSTVLWPAVCAVNDRPVSYASSLLGGADLPSPIPHVPSGLETAKNRRSPVDEIVSSTPRSTPTSNHGSAANAAPHQLQMQMQMRSSSELVAHDSRQLNFGRISTPKTSRFQSQDTYQNHVEANSNQKLRNRTGSGKTVQTTAGPLLPSTRYNPAYDAGIYVNVNSPGFTDRLVRCASDNTGLKWSNGGVSTQQDRYNSVGLFPVVHLNSHSPPSLTTRNSQKAPNSTVRVRIAQPVYTEQRQHCMRGTNAQMRSYIPARESYRRNEVAKSVLESLQEASRKRIYSQCQEVLEDESGKKRQRKGDSALPNPNCDIYQYRHIRAPPVPSNSVPSSLSMNTQNDIHVQGKRVHDDPSPRANEPKRQRQHAKPQSANNEISSSLSSSKTLLQRLSGNKRKADCEYAEDSNGKHFKESFNAAPASSSSRWLHSRPCDEGESAARTQEVVRSQRISSDSSPGSTKTIVQKKRVVTENVDLSSAPKGSSPTDKGLSVAEKTTEKSGTDLSSKLFRKEITSRSHPKMNVPEKKASSWTQMPPDADERCLLEQSNSSELDRPERFQSLLSRMCGQDVLNVKQTSISALQSEQPKTTSATSISTEARKSDSNKTLAMAVPSSSVTMSFTPSTTTVSNLGTVTVSSAEVLGTSQSLTSAPPISLSFAPSLFTTPPQTVNFPTSTSSTTFTTSTHEEKTSDDGKQVQADGPVSSAQPSLTAISTSPSKPMFNYTPMSSPTSPRPRALPVTEAASSASSAAASSFAQSMSTSVASPSLNVNPGAVVQPPEGVVSTTPVATTAQSSAFSFLSGTTQSVTTMASDTSTKNSTVFGHNAVTFTTSSQKPQFSFGSGISTASQQKSDANGTTNIITPIASTNNFSATSLPQSQAPAVSSNGEQKNSFGGFKFSGSSGSLFSQPVANAGSTVSSFSFSPPTTIVNANPAKVDGVASGGVSDSKGGSGSGSITFGTVSTVVTKSTNSSGFSFSTSSGNLTGIEPPKAPFQLISAISNQPTSGFTNPSQGIFNGFSSISNSTTPAVPAFGASLQQGQSQNQASGGFSFRGSNEPAPSVNFGAVAPTSSSIFGNGTSQQPSFGATTTAGFALPSATPSFSSSPFGSSASAPFGSSQPSSAATFVGQVASSNPPAFGMPSSSPPTFGSNSVNSGAPTFGTTSAPSFGVSSAVEPSFGANAPSAPTATSAFSFGSAADKPTVPAFNFGGNSVAPAPAFSFGSAEQQQQPPPNSGGALFQFGQTASSNPGSAFQFGSPSAQPGGSGGFSVGSGPSTPQRTRSLQTRRRRI